MNLYKISILPLIIFLTTGCIYSMQLPIDLSYAETIARAEFSDMFDGRIELKYCVKNWKLYPERDAMLSKLISKGYFDSPQYVLLEIGNAGFGSYDYAYIWRTDSVVNIITNLREGKKTIKIEYFDAFWNDVISLKEIKGDATRIFQDGDGFFITLKNEKYFTQFAVYEPRVGEKDNLNNSERIVNLIMELINEG